MLRRMTFSNFPHTGTSRLRSLLHSMCAVLVALMALLLAASPAAAKKYALLVGVSDYAHLRTKAMALAESEAAKEGARGLQPLQGPGNDVVLMWHVLTETLGFTADNITVLADRLPDRRPDKLAKKGDATRAEILEELKRIKGRKDKDFVVVYFSGHGVQVDEALANGDKEGREQDAKSETFLPSDTGLDSEGRPTGFISDSDFNKIFYEDGGFQAPVWAIFDSCHSGDVTRSNNRKGIVLRSVDLDALRKDLQKKAPPKPASTATTPTVKRAIFNNEPSDKDVVVFAAAGASGSAIELQIRKEDGQEAPWHGGFTYLLAETMFKHKVASYAELLERLNQAFAAFKPALPRPHVEGNLGLKLGGAERVWSATTTGGVMQLDVGAVHGVKVNDFVSIRGSDQTLLGYARVDKAEPLRTTIEAVERLGAPRLPAVLPAGATARPEPSVDFSLTVARPRANHVSESSDWVRRGRAAVTALENLRDKRINVRWVDPDATRVGDAAADVYLAFPDERPDRPIREGVLQFRGAATEDATSADALTKQRQTRFSPRVVRNPPAVKLDARPAEEIAKSIEDHLLAVLAQRNLLSVASQFGAAPFARGVKIDVWVDKLHRRDETQSCKGVEPNYDDAMKRANVAERPTRFDPLNPVLHHCDIIYLVIDNSSGPAVDVTCLYLDADGGVAAGFAGGMRERRSDGVSSCPDGRRINSGTVAKAFPLAIVTKCHKDFPPCQGSDKDMPVGPEHLMIILVEVDEKDGRKYDFDELNRPAAERVAPIMRSAPPSTSRPALDELRRLLGQAVRSGGETRGEAPRDPATHFKTFSWTVEPTPRTN